MIKYNFFTVFFILISFSIQAQNVGIGTTDPDESAALDIVSSDKGLLIPRVDTSEVDDPSNGLLVILTGTSDLYKYNGSKWEEVGKIARELRDEDNDTGVKLIEGGNDRIFIELNGSNKFLFFSDSLGRSRIEFTGNKDNIAIGRTTLSNNTTGLFNVAIGGNSQKNNSTGFANNSIGYNSLLNNTSGVRNVVIGNASMINNKTGDTNIAIGQNSMQGMIEGYDNIAIGFNALNTNTSGNSNVAIGFQAGKDETGSNKLYIENTSGNSTQALIYGEFDNDFLRLNGEVFLRDGMVDADKDTKIYFDEDFVGDRINFQLNTQEKITIKSDTTGRSNIEFLNNNLNISIGRSGLNKNENGNSNIVIGDFAMEENINGSGNVAIGVSSLRKSETGVNNVGIGNSTFENSIQSDENVAMGFASQKQLISANKNSSFGFASLESNQYGSRNTALGYAAMQFATGSGNVAIGYQAGMNETGSNKLYIENSAAGPDNSLVYGEFDTNILKLNGQVSVKDRLGVGTNYPLHDIHLSEGSDLASMKLANNGNNGVTMYAGTDFWGVIHSDSSEVEQRGVFLELDLFAPLENNTTSLGAQNFRWTEVFATNGTINTSDKNLKKNIVNLNYGLSEVMQMRPVSYQWKDKEQGRIMNGFLAQEMEEVIPEVVHVDKVTVRNPKLAQNSKNDGEELYGLRYTELIPVLTKAIQEQQEIIITLQQRIEALEAKE